MDCAENRIDETTDWIILRAWRVASDVHKYSDYMDGDNDDDQR